jgi:hypothetical protein
MPPISLGIYYQYHISLFMIGKNYQQTSNKIRLYRKNIEASLRTLKAEIGQNIVWLRRSVVFS